VHRRSLDLHHSSSRPAYLFHDALHGTDQSFEEGEYNVMKAHVHQGARRVQDEAAFELRDAHPDVPEPEA
jgi:hypothetical protein